MDSKCFTCQYCIQALRNFLSEYQSEKNISQFSVLDNVKYKTMKVEEHAFHSLLFFRHFPITPFIFNQKIIQSERE